MGLQCMNDVAKFEELISVFYWNGEPSMVVP